MSFRPPNIVIVVLDCVRASDFPGGDDAVAGTPFLDRLQKECVVFPRSVSASSWTVPTHASILTGLYPCDHGAYSLGSGTLPGNQPTLPEVLKGGGYATALVSANHNLRPSLGLTRGFDRAWWGSWGVTSLRLGRRDERPFTDSDENQFDRLRAHTFERGARGVWKLWTTIARELPRHPWILDGVSRVIQGVRNGGRPYDSSVAPWIGSTLADWLGEFPPNRPLFALINLMDAHEPYLPDLQDGGGLRQWWARTHIRQDVANWADGRWNPTEDELAAIRGLYREKLRGLDSRIAEVVGILKRSDRWEDCLFIVTSDHGQAFGEGGHLFHGDRLVEELVRVPLWVRFPASQLGGTISDAWSSSVDLFPTALRAASLRWDRRTPGKPLAELASEERSEPVYSMVRTRTRGRNGEHGPINESDGFAVAGYYGSFRVQLTLPEGVVAASKQADGNWVSVGNPNGGTQALGFLMESILKVGQTIPKISERSSTARSIGRAEIDARLRSWGYD